MPASFLDLAISSSAVISFPASWMKTSSLALAVDLAAAFGFADVLEAALVVFVVDLAAVFAAGFFAVSVGVAAFSATTVSATWAIYFLSLAVAIIK